MRDIRDDAIGVYHLSGRQLAYVLRGKSAKSAAHRAAIAAWPGGLVLANPTTKQLAVLFEIPVSTLAEARALYREEIRKNGTNEAWEGFRRDAG